MAGATTCIRPISIACSTPTTPPSTRAGRTKWNSACSATTAPGAGCWSAARRISGPSGEFEGFIGTCIDITEHRETVEALRESRARFKTLTESLPQMIWTCTRDGYTDYLSRQWLDYTGRSESQQLGKGWLEQVHPEDRVKVRAGMGARRRHRRRLRHELPHPPLRRRVSLVQDARGAAARSGRPHPQVVRLEHRHRGLRGRQRASSRCSSSACSCSIAPRRPSARTRNRARSSRWCCAASRTTSASISAASALYQAEPQLLTVGLRGRTQPGAGARSRPRRAARRSRWTRTALARCVRGELVYEPDIETPQLPFPARLASRRPARAGGRAADDRRRGVRRAAGGQAQRRFLQQRRLRIPAAAVAVTWRWPRTRRGSTTRCRSPTRTCARPSRR